MIRPRPTTLMAEARPQQTTRTAEPPPTIDLEEIGDAMTTIALELMTNVPEAFTLDKFAEKFPEDEVMIISMTTTSMPATGAAGDDAACPEAAGLASGAGDPQTKTQPPQCEVCENCTDPGLLIFGLVFTTLIAIAAVTALIVAKTRGHQKVATAEADTA